jgi:3-hydroxyacyl-CoA dehydrogenase/enoyl-CoA hydratase/3-hydroxybutyryl-CoA epimerase
MSRDPGPSSDASKDQYPLFSIDGGRSRTDPRSGEESPAVETGVERAGAPDGRQTDPAIKIDSAIKIDAAVRAEPAVKAEAGGKVDPGVYLEEAAPGVAAIVFRSPSRRVNVLTSATLDRLRDLIREIRSTTHFRAAVVRSDLPGTFIAGADVNEVAAVKEPALGLRAARLGQSILQELAELPIPTVAAINGTCLGGGTELALACCYRVASDSEKVRIGLPEVRLGIIPGWGGTQRLSRVIGLPAALELVLTGRALDSRRAKRRGLVDLVIPDAIFQREAIRFAERAASGSPPTPQVAPFHSPESAHERRISLPLRDRFLESRVGRELLFRITERRTLASTKGHYRAPLVALDVMRRGFGRPLRDALELEADALGERIVSEEKRALVHIFFLSEQNRRDTGVTTDVSPRTIHRAGLIGAGVMGGGIARLLSQGEIPVRMKDLSDEALLGGLRSAKSVLDRQVHKRILRRRQAEKYLSLIHPTLDYSGFGRVDVIFEAVVEKLEVKQTVLYETESIVREGTIFASNTSALSITKIAAASRRPEDVAGFHFFNPVDRMPLVEVIRGRRTSDSTVATLTALARRLGKTPIVCRDGAGFLVNRLLGRYLNEASHLLAEGLSVQRCDLVAVDFGMPMGPIRLLDEVGIDVAAKVAAILAEELGDRYHSNNLLERAVGDGRLGRKAGKGFYRYPAGRRKGRRSEKVDPEAAQLIETGGRAYRGSDREVVERLIYVMIDEAARCLDEGIVRAAGDVDLGMIFGTGFPAFRGGLLYYADSLGPRTICETLTRLSETASPRFAPGERLKSLATSGRRFHS